MTLAANAELIELTGASQNIRELHSLVDYAFFQPAISNAAGTGQSSGSDPFTNFQPFDWYWSSTTNANFPVTAWAVAFFNGFVANNDKDTLGSRVLAVRGGS